MRNKFIRLLREDWKIREHLILILPVVIILVFLVNKNKTQTQELRQLRDKIRLVAQLPELEARLRQEESKRLVTVEKPQPKKINFVLSGIIIEDRGSLALINGRICREGDSLEGFSVSKIAPKVVILQDKNSNQAVKLTLQ